MIGNTIASLLTPKPTVIELNNTSILVKCRHRQTSQRKLQQHTVNSTSCHFVNFILNPLYLSVVYICIYIYTYVYIYIGIYIYIYRKKVFLHIYDVVRSQVRRPRRVLGPRVQVQTSPPVQIRYGKGVIRALGYYLPSGSKNSHYEAFGPKDHTK